MNINFNKELDPVLIRRANDSSIAFHFGDGIVWKYKNNISLIIEMRHLSDEQKIKTLEKLHKLRTKELFAQGNAIGPYTYGPAVINKDRDEKNFDKAIKARVIADGFIESLQTAEEQYKMAKKKEYIRDTFLAAEEKGLKVITVEGETWYKLRKNWTTKKPKPK